MKKNKNKKGILLFEVALAVLIVSIISLFLFRGYSLFTRVQKKGLDYLRLALLCEEKAWDLQLKEKKGEIDDDLDTEGSFDAQFSWYLSLEDSDYDNLKEGILITTYEKRESSLDVPIYLIASEGEEE